MRRKVLISLLISSLVMTSVPLTLTQNASARSIIYLDTDADFAGGSFNNTTTFGTGSGAFLGLTYHRWYDPGWGYREEINITEESGNDLRDFQVRLLVNTSAPIADGRMNANYSDLRFSDILNNELAYWIKGPYNATHTELWVNVPYLNASDVIPIYMYYGNPSAPPASDFDTVFYWTLDTIDTGMYVGSYPSLAVGPDNLPQITYWGDPSYSQIRYASILPGDANWTTEIVHESSILVGAYSDISVDSKNIPHVIYYTGDGSVLNYTNRSTGSWMAGESVANPYPWTRSGIAIDSNDVPHVSSKVRLSEDLQYENRTTGTWIGVPVDGFDPIGNYSSLDIDSFKWPHIAYYDNTNMALKYANYTGSWSYNPVEILDDVGLFPTIKLDSNEKAHIVYYDNTASTVKYAYQEGVGWNIRTLFTDASNISGFDLNSVDEPAVSWYTNTFNALAYSKWNGTSWLNEILDFNGTPLGSSLAFDSYDFPMIAYQSFNGSNNLRFAHKRKLVSPEPTHTFGTFSNKSFVEGDYETPVIDLNVTGELLTLRWGAQVLPNTTLKFQIASNATWNYTGPDGTNLTFYNVSPASIWPGHLGDRYFKVKAYFNSTNSSVSELELDWISIEINRSPDQPTGLNPADTVWTSDDTPLFSWTFNDQDPPDAQSDFQLQIDDDSGFGSVDFDSGVQAFMEGQWAFPSGTAYSTLPDGSWYWRVRATDGSHWSEYSAANLLNIDTTAPVTTLHLEGNNYSATGSIYIRPSVDITLDADDGGGSGIASTWYKLGENGTWQEYSGGINLTGLTGRYLLYYNSTDNQGNSEISNVLALIIDSESGPTSDYEILGAHYDDSANSGLHYITSASVISLTMENVLFPDMARIKYRFDGGAWLNYTENIRLDDNGEHLLEFYAVDEAGNEEPVNDISVFVDDEPPVTTLHLVGNNYSSAGYTYVRPSVDITLDADDGGGSGVASTWYKLGVSATLQKYSGPIDLTGLTGQYLLSYNSTDNLGNSEIPNVLALIIDSGNGPTSDYEILRPYYDDSANSGLHYITSDSVITLTLENVLFPDMSRIKYRFDWGAWLDYTDNIQLAGISEGEHLLEFYAVDEAGNEEPVNDVSVFVDDEPPVTSLTPMISQTTVDGVIYVTRTTALSMSPFDLPFFMAVPGVPPVIGSGIATSYYKVDNGLWTVHSSPLTPGALGLTAGMHKIGFYSVDNLGNMEAARHIVIFIDDAVPTARIGGDMMVMEDRPVNFNGFGSTDDGRIINWTWIISLDNGTRAFPETLYGGELNYTFEEPGDYKVALSVADVLGNTDNDTISVVVTANTDTDQDGLPDAWELEYFENLNENASGDPDLDNLTNAQELELGTDPTIAEESVADRYFLLPFLPWWLGWLLMLIFLIALIIVVYLYKSVTYEEEEKNDVPAPPEKPKEILPPPPMAEPFFEDAPEVPEHLAEPFFEEAPEVPEHIARKK